MNGLFSKLGQYFLVKKDFHLSELQGQTDSVTKQTENL